MYIITDPEISIKYDLGGDTLISNLNEFLTKCILGSVEPQKIVIDERNDEACKTLEDMGFEIVLLHSYLKFKKPIENTAPKPVSTQTTSLFSEPESVQNQTEEIATPIQASQKKQSFFSRLFGSKKKETNHEVIAIDDNFLALNNRLIEADQRGAKVKNYCLEHNYLNNDQIKQVERLMEQAETFGEHKRFIQTAREAKLLTEDQAAKVLSNVTSKEVISKTKCNIEQLQPYNSEMLNLLSDFFIFRVDDKEKVVYICKDCSIEPKLHLLERKYMGYHVVVYNVVEGVTRDILDGLKGRAKYG